MNIEDLKLDSLYSYQRPNWTYPSLVWFKGTSTINPMGIIVSFFKAWEEQDLIALDPEEVQKYIHFPSIDFIVTDM